VDAGITNILTVHDCFYCLAPQVVQFNKIIRSEMTKMYLSYDVLARLRDLNVSDPHNPALLPVPPYGKLDPFVAQDAEFSFA
jgi:DNA-dependent RNA polymerase